MSNESKDNSRRIFLKKAAGLTVLSGLSVIPFWTEAKSKSHKLTILHTNDTHSQVYPFALNDPQYPGLGGVARRNEIIKKERTHHPPLVIFVHLYSFSTTFTSFQLGVAKAEYDSEKKRGRSCFGQKRV